MALFLVNRQIFNESVPVLYEIHRFHVSSIALLIEMLTRCGSQRPQHFAHISFRYWYPTRNEAQPDKAFTPFAPVRSLRTLHVSVHDRELLSHADHYDSRGFKSVDDIPGMKLFGSIRVKSFEC